MLDNETEATVNLFVSGGPPPEDTQAETIEIDRGGEAEETHGGGGSGKGRAEKGFLEGFLEKIDPGNLNRLPFDDTHGGGGSGKG